MPLIVDTYNVLHVVGVLPPDLAGIDTQGLIDLIGRSRYRGERAFLICDGRPRERAPRGRFGPLSVRYAGGGSTADELIEALIQTSSSPRRLTVVSSDRQIVRAARRQGISDFKADPDIWREKQRKLYNQMADCVEEHLNLEKLMQYVGG